MSRQAEPKGQNVAAQGGVVASMTLLSRISGFVRDVVLSYFFGASGIADAFFVAFRIPNFFRRLFAEGAFNQAFVPVLARYRDQPRAELEEFVRVIFGNLSTILLVVVFAGVLFAPGLVTVFAPGFRADPVRFELATTMVRITFPYLGFISLTAFAGSLLNSHHRYAIPAFTPVLLNISLISAALTASLWVSEPVYALAWGVLLAGIAQLLFQIVPINRLGLLLMPKLSRHHEGAKRVGGLLLPAMFASSVGQINALIDTMLASTLVTGSISWLYYSDRLLELPIGLVAVALGTVLLPNLSRLAREGSHEGFQATLDWGLRMAILFGLPAAVALYVMALPLIATIFLHGALTSIDALMASLSLRAFAVGLLPLVLIKVLAPAFFAHEDTRSPFRAGVVAVAVNIVINLSLFQIMGHVGLALGTACAAWVNVLLLARGLRIRKRLEIKRPLLIFSGWCGIASVAMAIVLLLISPDPAIWLSAGPVIRGLWSGGLVTAGGLTYLVVLLICGIHPRALLHRA
jgi:putative peptidoglycan lipid II flippase